jgi:hypothetical protein
MEVKLENKKIKSLMKNLINKIKNYLLNIFECSDNIITCKEKFINYTVVILISLLFVLGIFISEMFSFIGIFVLVFYTIFSRVNVSTYLLIILLPNQRLFTLDIISITTLNIPILILFIKMIFIKKWRLNNNLFIILSFFLFYSIIPSIVGNTFFPIFVAIRLFLFVFLLDMSIEGNKKEYKTHVKNLINAYVNGILIMSFIALVIPGFFVMGDRFSAGPFNNPNDFSVLVLMALIFKMYLASKKGMITFKDFIFVPILTILGFLSQSRTFIFGLLIIGIIFIFKTIFDLFKGKTQFVKLLSFLLFLFLILYISPIGELIINPAINRILNPRGGDITAERLTFWFQYINHAIEYPILIFLGAGNESGFINLHNISDVPHNAIIELVLFSGVVGLMIFIAILIKLFQSISDKSEVIKIGLLDLTPLIVIFGIYMTRHNPINISFIYIYFVSTCLIFYQKGHIEN